MGFAALNPSYGRNAEPLLPEAVEQPVAAGGDEIRLAAAARHVGRDPGRIVLGRRRIALAIDVAEHGAAERAAGPVVAGQVAGEGFRAPARGVLPGFI